MPALLTRLKNFNEAGVCRLEVSPEELRTVVAQTGFTLYEINLANLLGKDCFLAAMAETIQSPDWFGNNWDALADSLGDLSWHPAAGYVLLLKGAEETLGLSEADYGIVSKIFSDTSNFWKSQSKPFWIIYC